MTNEITKRLLSSIILIPITLFFIVKGNFFFSFFIIICLFTTMYEWYMMRKNKTYHYFGHIFLLLSFCSAYLIREDLILFLSIILICILTDIGGFVFGKTFKGPKLTKISPKKTYAGVIGSFLLSLTTGIIFVNYTGNEPNKLNADGLPVLLIILFISFVSQVGDLIISYFKRKAKLKDTGKIIPGHGGVLDRIDGLIFVFPAIYVSLLIIGSIL